MGGQRIDMKVREMTAGEYRHLFPSPPHLFNSADFNELNRYKCDEVSYLAFADTRIRAAIVVGIRDGMLHSPFSAPFGGLTTNRSFGIGITDSIFKALLGYCRERNCGLRVTLPPSWHDERLNALCVSSLSRIDGVKSHIDLSYHMPLAPREQLIGRASSCARGAFRKALSNDMRFEHLALTDSNLERVYNLVKRNHDERGFPVRMSLPDMAATARLADGDLFTVSENGTELAGAIVFKTRCDVAQPIIWGDLPEFHSRHSMNRLALEIADHYYRQGISVLDLGPSTEHTVPNYGLCFFKEGMGCIPSLKHTFMVAP